MNRSRLAELLVKEESQHVAVYYFLSLAAVITAVVWGLHCLYMNVLEARRTRSRRTPEDAQPTANS